MEKRCILLVDDDIDHTSGIEQRLVMDGFEVDRATNAKQAYNKIENGKYYGVILDIMMPSGGLFGYDQTDQDIRTGILLCKKIREDFDGRLRIIGLTNHHDEDIKRSFVDSGGEVCLEKIQLGVAGIISEMLSN